MARHALHRSLHLRLPLPSSAQKFPHLRPFATTPPRPKNRIYTSVRNADDFENLLLLSSSSRTALLTLWTASWCRTCKTVAPLVADIVSSSSDASAAAVDTPPVGYAEVEMDAPDMAEINPRYQVRSVPMLLAFSRGEPQYETAVTDARKLGDRRFLEEWLATEAKRVGEGGAEGGLFGFGSWFGGGKK